jgi:hypothetical protein
MKITKQSYHAAGAFPELHPSPPHVKTVAVARTLILLLLLASCGTPAPPPATPPPVDVRAETLALLESLERSFYSHWGSVDSTLEYRRIRDEQIPVLRQIADSNGEQALMALRILARRAPQERFSPAAKAILYWSMFQRETFFNRWGVISKSGFIPGIYGAEMMSLGAAAAPYLQKSLGDTRRAPVFGGEEERTSRIQGDRVCDYAWVLLATMFDRPLAYHADPRLRDPQIQELDLWLDRRGRK